MQRTQYFSGTQPTGGTEKRRYAYGSNGTLSMYTNRVGFINRSVADFLSGCGVNAAWEQRDGDTEYWLYIENIPFLVYSYQYTQSSSAAGRTYTSKKWRTFLYHPCLETRTTVFDATFRLMDWDEAAETDTFNFGLVFCGDAKTGWCLRFKPYNSTAINSTAILCFYNATHLCTGNKGAIISGTATNSKYGVRSESGNKGSRTATTIEIADGAVVPGSVHRKTANSTELLSILTVKASGNNAFWGSCDSKLPLIPITCGLYKANGCYLHIPGMRIPAARKNTEEAQTRVDIGGKIFVNTCVDEATTGYISMGLIDVTQSEV